MPIITLTTDWRKSDYYIGALKGKILSLCSQVNIVDITHQIRPFNIPEAAFILRNTYSHFPDNTIHIIGVKSHTGQDQEHVVVKKDNQFFIANDNGIFGLLFRNEPEEVIQINQTSVLPTFPTFSVFAEVAVQLANGTDMKELGTPVDTTNKKIPLRPTIDESVIIGSVVYIDSFSNAITNITKDLFYRVANNRKFQIFVQSNTYKINKISKTYQETPEGELLAIFNSLNLLEIAMNGGNAAQIMALTTDSTVRVRFL
jgi:hypothetical protein